MAACATGSSTDLGKMEQGVPVSTPAAYQMVIVQRGLNQDWYVGVDKRQ